MSGRIVLPDHPWYPNDLMAPDHALLDELAAAHGRRDMADFLFGYLARALFERLLGGHPLSPAGALWAMYLSGYFGGVWLRAALVAAQPEGFLATTGRAPDEGAFRSLVDGARDAIDNGADIAALVDNYGYNHGYLLEILESPPAGLEPPAGFAWPDRIVLVGERADAQAAAEARGREVWSSGLSVQGFRQHEYDQLLDLSASYLAVTRATAEAAIAGAKPAAVAGACLGMWTGSYAMGLFDDRPDRRLPAFA